MLSDEEGLPGRAEGLREIQALAVESVERRLPSGRGRGFRRARRLNSNGP